MTGLDDLVLQAGRDLIASHTSDSPASGLKPFVSRYFPRLKARSAGEDLQVENSLSEHIYVRREKRRGHRGWISFSSSDDYRASEPAQLLNAGGARRDTKSLVDQLAAFNNRTQQV